ncbi:hypothetical protein chiPu_0002484 [Chiloscyllium punctatum]|uniref:Uncharacterized protein n=1 Tax=Chiloscyllium punctatum TaxID=137246 RepID=A0A401S124_CHIPU|nr:hypothetical protein [Chiloscyllium punctatum]
MQRSERRMPEVIRYENPSIQIFIKSGHQFLDKVRSFLATAVRENKIQQERARDYFKEVTIFCIIVLVSVSRKEKMALHLKEKVLSKCGDGYMMDNYGNQMYAQQNPIHSDEINDDI